MLTPAGSGGSASRKRPEAGRTMCLGASDPTRAECGVTAWRQPGPSRPGIGGPAALPPILGAPRCSCWGLHSPRPAAPPPNKEASGGPAAGAREVGTPFSPASSPTRAKWAPRGGGQSKRPALWRGPPRGPEQGPWHGLQGERTPPPPVSTRSPRPWGWLGTARPAPACHNRAPQPGPHTPVSRPRPTLVLEARTGAPQAAAETTRPDTPGLPAAPPDTVSS